MSWTDHNGKEIEAGQHVAYNLSGEVAYGIILEVKEGKQYGKVYPKIKIRQLLPTEGHESTVRSSKNLMVIPSLIKK